jgi:[acyl-carrier-protein] S-malonyltransferase
MPVFLFPGQGAQYSGMGMDLFEADADGSTGVRRLFDAASALLGSDIRELLASDAETLKRTDASQVAITVASLAAVRALAVRGIAPSACAGFSLGEYPALVAAGVLGEEDAIRLVIARGKIMQAVADELAASGTANTVPGDAQSAAQGAAGMAAVLGLSPDAVDAVIASLVADGTITAGTLFAANYNSPLQTVISGSGAALTLAEAPFKAAGARRVIRLKVAGPFHSPFMAKAGTAFASALEPVSFADPKIPLYSNVTGARVRSGSEAKACAVAHISSPVRWTMEERAISELVIAAAAGIGAGGTPVPELVEVGPGKVLSGLWLDSGLAGTCKPYTEVLGG